MSEPPGDRPLEQVRRVLAGQAKMIAIKRYRDSTGAGWVESAEAVEAMRDGGKSPAAGGTKRSPKRPPDAIGEALRAGNKIEAIRLYRAATGVGLAEAKHAIDAISAGANPKLRLSSPKVIERRRLGPAMALVLLAALGGTLFGVAILIFARH